MAEVQLVVRQVSTQVPVTINLSLALGQVSTEDEGGATPAEAARSTGAACVSSISALARHDPASTNELSKEDRANLQFTTDGEGGEGASYGAVFGEVVRGFADQFHRQVEEYTDSVVEEDPSQSIMSLQNELDGVFDVTEGKGRFNSGRVMAAFYLTYSLVKKYYQRYGNDRILPFLRQLLPSVVSYLFRIGFMSWLVVTGGWEILRAVTRADSLVSSLFRVVRVTTLATGMLWFSWRVFRYFWH